MSSGGGGTVPKTNNDPIWSLCPWPVELSLGDKSVEIPPMPAVDWLQYLFTPDTFDVDGLIADFIPELEDYAYEKDLTISELYETALNVISVVAARPWWLALRIIFATSGAWNIFGPKLMISGVDAASVSLAAWLDMSIYLIIENMDPKNVTMFTSQLENPPKELLEHFGQSNTIDGELAMEEMAMDRSAFLALGR